MSVTVCPPPEDLTGFRAGTLVLDRHLGVAKHLKACDDCRRRLARLPAPADNTPADDPTFPGLPAAALETALETDPTDARVGPYRLIRMLGRGGMGVVYEAEHEKLKNRVAVKILPRATPADPDAAARFRREWQAVGRLHHPNVVRALHADDAGGVPFLAMELIDGTDLGKVVQRTGPLAPADAAAVVRAAAVGLAHAHAQGVIHRDVKPSNLLLTAAGEVKLLDLGLAQLSDAAGVSTQKLTGPTYLGTFDYMAPEQWDDATVADGRTDVYALGCVLFYLLSGKPPFAAPDHPTPLAKMRAHKDAPPPDPRAADPAVPAGLAEVLAWMLRKDPIDRPMSAAVAADALEPFAADARLDKLAVAAGQDAVGAFDDGQLTSAAAGPPTALAPADEPTRAAPRPRRAWSRPRVWIPIVAAALAVAAAVIVTRQPSDPVTVGPAPDTIGPAPSVVTPPAAVPAPPPATPVPPQPASPPVERPMVLPVIPCEPTLAGALAIGTKGATAVAFTADGKTALIGRDDGEVIRWDLDAPAPRSVFTAKGADGKATKVLAIAPIGTRGEVLVAAGRRVWSLNPNTGSFKVMVPALPAMAFSLSVSPNGLQFAVGHITTLPKGGDGSQQAPAVTVYDAAGKEKARWKGPAGRKVWVVATNRSVLAADDHGDVLHGDRPNPQTSYTRTPGGDPKFRTAGLVPFAGGRQALLVGYTPFDRPSKTAVVWWLDTLTGQTTWGEEAGPLGLLRGVGVSPDGRTTYLGGHRGQLYHGDPASGTFQPRPLAHFGGVGHVAVSPDGRRLITAGFDEPLARVWDLTTEPVAKGK